MWDAHEPPDLHGAQVTCFDLAADGLDAAVEEGRNAAPGKKLLARNGQLGKIV